MHVCSDFSYAWLCVMTVMLFECIIDIALFWEVEPRLLVVYVYEIYDVHVVCLIS